MYRIFRHYVPKTLLMLGFAEALILLVSVYIGATVRLVEFGSTEVYKPILMMGPVLPKAVIFSLGMILVMTLMGLYQRDLRDGTRVLMLRIALSFLLGLGLMAVFFSAFPDLFVGRGPFLIAIACAFVGIVSCRLICYQRTDELLSRRVLVLGVGAAARQIEQLRRRTDRSGLEIVGFLDLGTDPQLVDERKILKTDASLKDIVQRFGVDELVVALDDRRNNLPINDFVDLKMSGVQIIEPNAFYERQLGKIRLDSLRPSNVIFADGFNQQAFKAGSKRAFDILVSLAMLLAAAPIMLAAALLILLESGFRGPILYRQERVGMGGRIFNVIKFRSMVVDAEKNGAPQWAAKNDPRVTRVGAFIRKTRIDELPQLINVLKGDMSFVGPRPERPQFVDELAREIPYYNLRHYVKPGITGWAQICYPYGASTQDAVEKLQYDLYYLKNYSLFLDFTVLLQTAQVILWGKGAR